MSFLSLIFSFLNSQLFAQTQDSLTLKNAISLALEKNYGIVLAKNAADIAKLQNNWGNAGLVPNIALSSNYNYSNTNLHQELANGTVINRNGVNNQSINLALAGVWTVFDGQRMFVSKNRLEQLQKLGETQTRQAIVQTVYNVSVAYYEALRISSQIAYTQEFISLLTEREKIAKVAFEGGSSAKTDWLQSRLDLEEQKIALNSQQANLQKAKASINALLLREPSAPCVLQTYSAQWLATPDFTRLESQLNSQNTQWLVAQHSLVLAQLNEKDISSQRWPVVQVLSGYNLNNSRSDAGFNLSTQNRGPYVGLGLRIPLVQSNSLRVQQKVAQLQTQNQKLSIESLKNDLKTWFYNARISYENAQQTMNFCTQNSEIAKENQVIALKQFQQKQIGIIELRQVQLNYQNVLQQKLNAQHELLLNKAYMEWLAADFVQ